MALKILLLIFPLAVLMASIVIQAGALTSQHGAIVNFNGNGGQSSGTPPTSYTCTSPKFACFPGGSLPPNSIVTCKAQVINGLTAACDLWDNCNNVPQGAFCEEFLWVFPIATGLDDGVTIYVNAAGQVTQATTASASFGFGALGVTGIIVMVTVGVSIAALAGITVFGSGENAESVHILFVGGLLLGLWAIVSVAEGFVPNGSVTSAFVKINVITSGLGTLFYIILTVLYMLGIVGTVSRGGAV